MADFFILSGTSLFLLAVSCLRGWATKAPAATASVTPATHHRRRARTRMSAFAGAVGLVCLVGIGAAHDDGVTTPTTSARTVPHSQSPR